MRISLALILLVAACGDSSDAAVCHFPSGRPCGPGELCLARAGDECNYVTCADGALQSTAVACQAGTTAPVAGGPFVCDPAQVALAQAGTLTPPPAPCPLGSLYALTVTDQFVGGGQFVQCVPLSQCQPIACDPAYAGDGCPTGYGCDATLRQCTPGA